MDYRQLGRSGLKVSTLCLGTMMFGGLTDEAQAADIIAAAGEQGVNFLDTADAYNAGRSEEIIGRALKGRRERWVVATKVAFPLNAQAGVNESGLSRRWIMQAVQASLRRLGTDHIDIYYLHKEDPETPLAETVRAMGDLMARGQVRYFGLSNYRSWRVAEICRLCDDMGIPRPVVSSPYYNALNRMPEVEHLPACGFYGLGVVPYSPRRAHWQIPARSGRARGHPRRPQGCAHDAGRMAARIALDRAADQGPCRATRPECGAICLGLGAEQPLHLVGDRWAAHPRAVGRLSGRHVLPLYRRGRGLHRCLGGPGSPIDSRL